MRRTANRATDRSAGSQQATPDVNVRVGRVVLHGTDARAAASLGGQVQAELARLVGGGASGSSTSAAPAAGGTHDAVAARIAQFIHARLPR